MVYVLEVANGNYVPGTGDDEDNGVASFEVTSPASRQINARLTLDESMGGTVDFTLQASSDNGQTWNKVGSTKNIPIFNNVADTNNTSYGQSADNFVNLPSGGLFRVVADVKDSNGRIVIAGVESDSIYCQ